MASSNSKESFDELHDRSEGNPEVDVNATAENAAGATPQLRCSDCKRSKLHSFNYLGDIPGGFASSEYIEVQFKNTRRAFYRNPTHIPLEIGDMVAVEASPGHDIGMVTLTGALAEARMRRATSRGSQTEIKRVFRKAKPADIEKFEEARAREDETMIRARQIAEDLKLNMKIGDVEFQGDGNKAIFYYIADERVDFRQLIKVLAEAFKVRIEMKQIGARQEAGRIGGIGPCGRPLCCSLWMTNFVSVATSAARYQDISLNPQKLAGQCAKLKCCLNFEVDAYVEASRRMPPRDVRLETADATYFHFKSDIFNRRITYSTDKNMAVNLEVISADRAFEIIAMNNAGEKPLNLQPQADEKPKTRTEFGDILGQNDLTRFDKKKKRKKKSSETPKEELSNTSNNVATTEPESQSKKQSTPQKNREAQPQTKEGGKNRSRHDFKQRYNGDRKKDRKKGPGNKPDSKD